MHPCDYCGKPNAWLTIDSKMGLDAWNRIYPEDQRDVLYTCGEPCSFMLGLKIGDLDDPYRFRDDRVRCRR